MDASVSIPKGLMDVTPSIIKFAAKEAVGKALEHITTSLESDAGLKYGLQIVCKLPGSPGEIVACGHHGSVSDPAMKQRAELKALMSVTTGKRVSELLLPKNERELAVWNGHLRGTRWKLHAGGIPVLYKNQIIMGVGVAGGGIRSTNEQIAEYVAQAFQSQLDVLLAEVPDP